jgi:hypothetical protein
MRWYMAIPFHATHKLADDYFLFYPRPLDYLLADG